MHSENELISLINSLLNEEEHSVKSIDHDQLKEPFIKENVHDPIEEDGFIEVRNNRLFIKDPDIGGRIPVLVYNKELNIYINGKKMTKDTPVNSLDEIYWEIAKQQEPFIITVSKDKMKVFFKLSPETASDYRLKNKSRSVRFLLEIETVRKKIDIKGVLSSIIESLNEKGIKADLKMDVVYKELIDPTFEEIVIAEGTPPINSKDASIELLFSEKKEESFEEVEGRIDFRNRVKIPSVDVGDLIAILHQPVEGQAGMNVYGKKIYPKPPKKIILRGKSNVKITDDGKVYALSKGRPSITGKTVKYIDILPYYEIFNDVNMWTGNIIFHGDVIVHGNVTENMRIESLGNVIIYGNVYSATIISAQNITVKGVAINSRLYAGRHGVLFSQIYETVQKLEVDMKKILTAFQQIMNVVKKRGLSIRKTYIFFLLMEQKFKNTVNDINKLLKIISEMERLNMNIPIQINIMKKILSSIFMNRGTFLETNLPHVLNCLLLAFKDVSIFCENSIKEDSNIEVGESDFSEIKTNGTVRIKKNGVIHSNIFAGKDCILEKNAVVRGGRIYASRQIIGGIIGSKSGDTPHLIAKKRIYAKEFYHGRISLNHQTIIVDEFLNNVEFSIDPTTKTISYNSLDNKKDTNRKDI
ncbi:FapA family protein [Calidifontibacillus erzurumensis]|uniref:DUF342 domain-containing protein n=1 Tax=Calidifontibacillus erzurumensis TaxID=2741433 RepID=A0A8J8KD70_9BACI|nr:FapA family protein [Calidifontibacillus erzurumensis]NSL52718.1 DUF342 domain-containing protein [Calidifontibacillus erzurumensis]